MLAKMPSSAVDAFGSAVELVCAACLDVALGESTLLVEDERLIDERLHPALAGDRRLASAAVDVGGGLGGLLVDLRDVPLRLPERLERRRELLDAWQRALWSGLGS